MRIAMLYPYPAPVGNQIAQLPSGLSTGGGETHPLSLSMKLAKRGHKVTYYTGRFKGITRKSVTIGKTLEVIYLPLFLGQSVQWTFSWQLLRYLVTSKFDAIHAHQLPTIFTFWGGLWAKLRGSRLVVTHLGFVPGVSRSARVLSWVNALLLDKLIVPNENSKRFYTGIVRPEQIEVLPYGIDMDIYRPDQVSDSLRVQYKPHDELIILYVGRILPSKGIDVLIRCLPHLTRLGLKAKLLIVGSGFFVGYLQELVQKLGLGDSVVFTGFVDSQQLPYYYTLADVVVLPSVYMDCLGNFNPEPEAFGLVLAEAMACGVPTVASRVGGIPYWIEDGHNGLLFSPGDEAELSTKIYALLTDPDLRDRITATAMAVIRERYSLDMVAGKLERIYHGE